VGTETLFDVRKYYNSKHQVGWFKRLIQQITFTLRLINVLFSMHPVKLYGYKLIIYQACLHMFHNYMFYKGHVYILLQCLHLYILYMQKSEERLGVERVLR